MTQKIITQTAIGRIYPALARLSGAVLPAKKSFKIYMLTKKIKEMYDFAIEEEKKMIKECNGEISESGEIRFEDEDNFKKFQSLIEELHKVEVNLEFEPVELSEKEVENLNITASDIMILEDFVFFK